MSSIGLVYCSACWHWKHISEYYTVKVYPGLTPWQDIWHTSSDGTEYGKPAGYCRKCTAAKQKGELKFMAYLTALRNADHEAGWRHLPRDHYELVEVVEPAKKEYEEAKASKASKASEEEVPERRWLTLEELDAKYGPRPDDL